MLPGLLENRMAPAQGVGGSARESQRQHRQDEGLGVPESVAVVAGARQPFGRDGAPLRTRSRLQDVEEREAYRLLDLRVALQLDVRTRPEVVQVGALLGEQALQAGQARSRQRGPDLSAYGRPRSQPPPS